MSAKKAARITMYEPVLAALLIVLGQARLFLSLPLLAYAGTMAVFFHLFVTGYEEPPLRRRFGATYLQYRRMVPRWIPRPPRRGRASHLDQQRNATNSEVSR